MRISTGTQTCKWRIATCVISYRYGRQLCYLAEQIEFEKKKIKTLCFNISGPTYGLDFNSIEEIDL